jgi:quinohemoprotein ethanol dehydrogenase
MMGRQPVEIDPLAIIRPRADTRNSDESPVRIAMTTSTRALIALLAFGLSGSALAAGGAATVDGKRIAAADSEPQNWLTHGRTYGEQRFSPLQQVNAANVGTLGLAWAYPTATTRGLQASPIVVDGRMYTTGTWSVVYALDARTGKELWKYDPEVPRAWGRYACCDAVNRGVALWKGAVYVATLDGRLIALDARNGKKRWEVNTIDRTKPYTITAAPRIVKG